MEKRPMQYGKEMHISAEDERKLERIEAAGPYLLAACKWTLQELEWGHDPVAAKAVLQQAIAKAEG